MSELNIELRALAKKAIKEGQAWYDESDFALHAIDDGDGEFIAAASPNNVIALFDTIESQQAQITQLKEQLESLKADAERVPDIDELALVSGR